MGLQSFERALENMVETVFSRSSRSSLRPVELGRRLLREMDDHRSVDVKGRRIVPNAFTFHLSARDHAGFAEIDHALNHELCEAAREYARDEGYHFVGPLSVSLIVDNTLKPGRFGVESQMREEHLPSPVPPAPAPATSFEPVAPPQPTFDPSFRGDMAPLVVEQVQSAPITIEPPAAPQSPEVQPVGVPAGRLVMPSGERVKIGSNVVSIGRLPECTITLSDANVSRRHAEIRPGNEIHVVDLGSTNGTKVNGLRIEGERVLSDGDIISLGSTHLRFEATNTSA
jgi:hypothetical protein